MANLVDRYKNLLNPVKKGLSNLFNQEPVSPLPSNQSQPTTLQKVGTEVKGFGRALFDEAKDFQQSFTKEVKSRPGYYAPMMFGRQASPALDLVEKYSRKLTGYNPEQPRLSDAYNITKGLSVPLASPAVLAGGAAIGSGIKAASNLLTGKKYYEDLGAGAARGMTSGAFYNTLGAVNPIARYFEPGGRNLGLLGRTAARAGFNAVREGVEGLVEGAIRPLNEGETRLGAIGSEVAYGAAFGGILAPFEEVAQSIRNYKKYGVSSVVTNAAGKKINAQTGKFIKELKTAAKAVEKKVKGLPMSEAFANLPSKSFVQVAPNKLVLNDGSGSLYNGLEVSVDNRGNILKVSFDNIDVLKNKLKGLFSDQTGSINNKGSKFFEDATENDLMKGIEKILPENELVNKPQKLNVKKLALDRQGKSLVRNLESPEPRLTLANERVEDLAKTADIRKRAKTMDQTADMAARDLATRQKVVTDTKKYFEMKQSGASQADLEKQLLEIVKTSKVSREAGTDIARQLQARSILADEAATPMQKVFKLLDNAGVDQGKYIKDATKVNWENANDVVDFYRKHVPAKFSEILDEFRYTNMLSSPNTQINNAFGNFLQTAVVTPVEKTITGGLDWIKSTLTGSERQYFARQGFDYSKGYIKALPDAFRNFKKAVTGELDITNLDLAERVPTGSKGLMKAYSTPLRLLEASDQFFRTLVKGGEMESLKTAGVTGEKALKAAEQSADYRLFRQKFDPNGELGQGGLLKVWDKWNSSINNLRNAPGGKWIVPFLSTPTNILKQGVEYSPVGLATIPGSKQPLEQLSKALVGSTVFATAYGMAESGLTTWDAPVSEKDRQEFYAAGLQPYSIKLGDKWVSFSKLGPLSYPLAMAAAMKWYEDNGGSSDKLTNLGAGVGGFLQFFADQSYMQGIGDLIDGIRGDEFKRDRALTNIPLQMVPYRALQGWFARIVDPVYRKAGGDGLLEKTTNAIKSQTPFLSKSLPAYEDPFGNPSPRQYPGVNAVSPLKITKENTPIKQNLDRKLKIKVSEKRAKDALEKDKSKAVLTGNKLFYYDDNGSMKSISKDFTEKPPKLTNDKDLNKKILSGYRDKLTSRQGDLITLLEQGVISESQAANEFKQLEEAKKLISNYSKKPKKIKIPKIPPIKIPKAKIVNTSSKVKQLRSRKSKKYSLKKIKKLTTSS